MTRNNIHSMTPTYLVTNLERVNTLQSINVLDA